MISRKTCDIPSGLFLWLTQRWNHLIPSGLHIASGDLTTKQGQARVVSVPVFRAQVAAALKVTATC